ncbi:MAG: NAD(P)-binding domain-containing protein [Rhodothermales bacterium]|nr:NAD(P)-binding domain-containing protein [Rhodothermales bacterium]
MTKTILPDGMYRTEEPVDLPEILDMLIVGGGPAGTAAAFRAKELGLSALVIDFDDILKRIRDYAKGKPILPSFGGGDTMKFPRGGDLVKKLHFEPIDKDDMCSAWKGYYAEGNIPVQVGVELTGLDRHEGDHWNVQCFNHRTKEEQVIKARHVVIGIGRGVPRRFDIPGKLDGVAYRLDDAENYVGKPACIIGGGTSAAEAVIAISNAKVRAEDDTPVYWAYRGDKMPKVSKALSEVFFEAYVFNGNVRYYPNSEPVAVVNAPDNKDYLSVRVDWRKFEGRPCETTQLEFEKTSCIACIGEDLPEKLLNDFGIHLFTGGPKMKKRVTVSPLLESQQPDVYLIGDILSQAYLEAEDFSGDPAEFKEIKHRGNVKSALRDGVFVTEVIKQKLDGKTQIHVELEFDDDMSSGDGSAEAAQAPAAAPASPGDSAASPAPADEGEATVFQQAPPSDGPPPESISEDRRTGEDEILLIRMTGAGVDEDEYPLAAGAVLTIGREGADLTFAQDEGLSAVHAALESRTDGVYLADRDSRTGTFLQLVPGKAVKIPNGTLLRLGQQFIHVAESGDGARVTCYDSGGKAADTHDVSPGETIVLGRQAPDFTLDAEDLSLSRRHLSIAVQDGSILAKDLMSVNGTWRRVRGEQRLGDDDVIRVGQQTFRLSLSAEEPASVTTFRVKPFEERASEAARPAAASAPPAEEPAAAPAEQPAAEPTTAPAGGEPSITFEGLGKTIPVPNGKTICDVAEAEGISLNAECHAGICGSDPIRIVSGAEFLNRAGGEESDTLEDICDLEAGNEAGKCRLACMAKVTGPVVVEIVEQ